MAMSIFRVSDYTGKKDTSATKGHYSKKRGIRQISHWKNKDKFIHCPRVCQQKENGTLGKKTFDGKKCSECGYVR
jgi:hypothetical protein